MKKSFLTSLCALCTLFFIPSAVKATDYTVEPNTPIKSTTLPVFINSTSLIGSLTQQILLASELGGAPEGDITDISFYYGLRSGKTSAASFSRTIQIWLMQVPSTGGSGVQVDSFAISKPNTEWVSEFLYIKEGTKAGKAGEMVYEGSLTTAEINSSDYTKKKVTLHLPNSFHWDGSSNIVMTVIDMTSPATTIPSDTKDNLQFYICQTAHPRFAHMTWLSGSDDNRAAFISNLTGRYCIPYGTNTQAKQVSGRSYVPQTTFSISTTIPAPTNLAASSISTSSAILSWDAVTGATGYNVRWGKTSGSLDHSQNNVAATSLAISDLDDGETYYFDVQTITAGGTSAFAREAHFNTTAVTHEHDDISFSKWASTTSMPTSGNYYLANNVTLDPYEPSTITLTGNLNLCLNGKTANLYGTKIVVPDDITFTIYDNVGGGKLTGFVESDVAWSELYSKALIVVYSGGTLVLKQGTIENTYEHNSENPSDGWSYAIYSNGTVRISGGVLINSNDADIYLHESRIITLDAAISNAEKHTVYITGGTFTSGWSTHMSAADPRDYFESANSGKSVCLSEGEAALRTLLHLSEESQNSGITTNYNQTVDVELTRSLTSAQYNTFCLPFALTNAQMAEFFGAGYDLEELTSSSLEEEILTLTFERKYELEAGKPYLLQPSIEVVNPSFEGVTITANMPNTIETTYADLRAIYRPTELAGDNHNLLFLGEDNTLFWPAADGNINGFRAYFVVKGAAANAVQARIGRAESQTTAIENQHSHIDNHKYMKEGQLFIERNGVIYNAQGQTIK